MEVRFFAPGGLVSQPRFRREHLRQRGRSVPAGERRRRSTSTLDRPHRLRDPRAAPDAPAEEGPRPAARRARPRDAERAAGMCWADEDELYNDGRPFKITSRSIDGVMVTILADNYFGYCKKEVKTQISFSANLFGLAEEEHAGGALAFATFSLGDRFVPDLVRDRERRPPLRRGAWRCSATASTFHDVGLRHRQRSIPTSTTCPRTCEIDVQQPGHQVDAAGGEEQHLKLLPGRDLHPPQRLQDPHGQAPRGAELAPGRHRAEGTFCHKPCTVSGGGKSEISKSLDRRRAATARSTCASFDEDMALVQQIFDRDYHDVDCPSSARASGAGPPLHSRARALARVGDQAAHAEPPSTRPSTTPGSRASRTTCARWCS